MGLSNRRAHPTCKPMKRAALILAMMMPLPATAHPHIFVDTGFEFIVNADNELTHVRVSWTYDDLYSLLLAEEFELDQDGDGALTPEEDRILSGFDMQWIKGYNGDLVILQNGQELSLSWPIEYTGTMEDGRVTTTHLRAVSERPLLTQAIEVKPFDATYYTAYEVTRPVTVTGTRDCIHQTALPDMDAALVQLQQELAQMDPNMDPEDAGFPPMGEKFASTVMLQCAAP